MRGIWRPSNFIDKFFRLFGRHILRSYSIFGFEAPKSFFHGLGILAMLFIDVGSSPTGPVVALSNTLLVSGFSGSLR